MTIELLVMISDQNEVTNDVWRAMDTLRKTRSFRLENAALIERDTNGKAHIQQYKRYPAWGPTIDDDFLMLFTHGIFNGDEETHKREVVVAEFGECLVEELEKAWLPHSSALLIFIARDSLVNTQEVLDHLSKYSGTLVHTSFPERSIKSMLELSNVAESQK